MYLHVFRSYADIYLGVFCPLSLSLLELKTCSGWYACIFLHAFVFNSDPQVDEVVSTPITLPVKERIALGLSEAGASNTLKVMTGNIVLGIIAVFAPGAIQQFCVFAVVVLVAHWFLVHTLFMAVLSIDLQRLEVSSTTNGP